MQIKWNIRFWRVATYWTYSIKEDIQYKREQVFLAEIRKLLGLLLKLSRGQIRTLHSPPPPWNRNVKNFKLNPLCLKSHIRNMPLAETSWTPRRVLG